MRLETLALRARRLRALLGRDGGPQVAAEPAEPAEPVAEVTRVGLCLWCCPLLGVCWSGVAGEVG